MCGIAGYISPTEGDEPSGVLQRMLDRSAHRGPDDEGAVQLSCGFGTVALGHRRLSIIDVRNGHQPMSDVGKEAWISFNGEIFNFKELKHDLIAAGRSFATQTDTEVILSQFLEQGEQFLSQLNGMFAFALWDSRFQRLFLARDRFGIKPLYYSSFADGGLAFASELTALMAHPKVRAAISSSALASYFFHDYVACPETLLEGTQKLPPASYVVWEKGQLKGPYSYWSPNLINQPTVSESDEDLQEQLRDKFQRSIRRQLISDVPVGIFLSGGLDSSAVALMAQEINRVPIKSFSIAFVDKSFDESRYARQVAKQLGTEHYERTLSEDQLLDSLDRVFEAVDEPMADHSLVPTFLLSELAAEQVKVVLGGDGGDELWAGYPTYRAHRLANWYRRVPKLLRSSMLAALCRKLGASGSYQSLEWKLKRFVLRWDEDPTIRHLRWLSNTDLPELERLLPSCVHPPRSIQSLASLHQSHSADPLNSLLAFDLQTYLPQSVLTKVDRASMANSLEVRPPFLDSEFVDWCFSLSSHWKLRRVTKFLLKRSLEGRLPQEILYRKKHGFGVPLARWCRGPLLSRIRNTLNESPLWESGRVERRVFAQWLEQHTQGRWDYSKPLWGLLVLDHWLKKEGVHEFA